MHPVVNHSVMAELSDELDNCRENPVDEVLAEIDPDSESDYI
jgi:hypothetical protein